MARREPDALRRHQIEMRIMHGRQRAMVASVLMMGAGALMIAVLPSGPNTDADPEPAVIVSPVKA